MLNIALNSLDMSSDCKQVQPPVEIEADTKKRQGSTFIDI
jgi:hypothetical protein